MIDKSKYISRGCYKKGNIPWNKDLQGVQKHTERSKKIMKEASMQYWSKKENREKQSKRMRGNTPPTLTKEHIEKIRIANLGRTWSIEKRNNLRKKFLGGNNPNYIDGRDLKWKGVRTKCFVRDNYECQLCHKRGAYINAHHIIERKKCKDIFDLTNLITLCRECHLKITNIEKYFKEEYKQWIMKFNSIIKNKEV
jgi:hypothetical protein